MPVEGEVVGPHHPRAIPRVVEAADGERDILVRRAAVLITQEGAVEPHLILGEIAPLPARHPAEGLIFRGWAVIGAGGQTHPGGDIAAQIDPGADAQAQAEAIAVLIDIKLRNGHRIGAAFDTLIALPVLIELKLMKLPLCALSEG